MEIVDEKLLTVKDVAKGLRERGYNLSEKALYKIVKENDFKHVRRINKGRKIAWFFEEEFLDELINYLEAERNKLTAPKIYSILKKEGINISMETLYKCTKVQSNYELVATFINFNSYCILSISTSTFNQFVLFYFFPSTSSSPFTLRIL